MLIPLSLVFVLVFSCAPFALPPQDDEAAPPSIPDLSTPAPLTLPSPLCPGPQPAYVTDFEARKPPTMDEPPPRTPFRDPLAGTCLVRVTDRKCDLAPDDPSQGIKNEYARVQSFNADGSYILLRSIEAEWYLYDATSLQPLGRLPLDNEPRWDAQDPALVYYNEETRLIAYNVRTGQETLVHDFAEDFPGQTLTAVWTHNEGRPSKDGRYWGFMAEDETWLPVAFLVYDHTTDTVTQREVRGLPGVEDDVDHVTISPLGTYFLAAFDRACEPGRLGDDAHPCGLMVYDRQLKKGQSLLRIIGHYDVALDAQEREVILYQDIDTDHIAMLDLETGTRTELWPIDFTYTPIGFHFSGLGYDRPGWALVSTYSGGTPNAFTWMDDQVFAVELKAEGRVVRLTHTYSQVDPDMEHDYWAEPHASTNPDLTRILFTSNWGRSGTEQVETYLIELTAGWPEMLP